MQRPDAPLERRELRNKIATYVWPLFFPDRASEVPDEKFYLLVDIIIGRTYNNVDLMIAEQVRNRLEDLL